MQSQFPTRASGNSLRLVAFLGPFGVPLLIAFECSLQSMIVFEGLFLAAFLLAAAFALRPFLSSRVQWPADRVGAWWKASILGTITASVLTLLYALQVFAVSPPPGTADDSASAAEYLTVAIGFPLILGSFQAFSARTRMRWPAVWPLVPSLGCAISYGASQVIEKLEAFDRSGLIPLALTLIVAFLITYWIQRGGLLLLRPKSA